jgi:hypothetical protein
MSLRQENCFYNHSQLAELSVSPSELWDKRVGRNQGNIKGSETTLGHAYSVIVEEMAQAGLIKQGFDFKRGYFDFEDFIARKLRDYGFNDLARDLDSGSMCYLGYEGNGVIKYVLEKTGLEKKAVDKVLFEIFGAPFKEI